MFNAKDYMIDRVRRITQVNLESGKVDWTATSIENPQVEFTGEATEKRDAYGVLINKFDNSKGVNFSGEVSTISMPMMASQLGTEMEVASQEAKIAGKVFEILPVDATAHTATTTFTPTTGKLPTVVYTIGEDKNINGELEVASAAAENKCAISGNTITFDTSFKDTKIGILYDYETEEAVRVVDNSELFAEAAEYIIEVMAADICNPASKRAGYLVFPKAKMDNNFTINLTAEGTHPFSISALKDYCSDEAELCYWVWNK